ncbi:MAG: hypothetical protein R3Y27_07110 [Clostridia bacterium]
MGEILIESFSNKKVQRLCTDYTYAKKQLDERTAFKLMALMNLIEAAATLKDIAVFKKYNVHNLSGNRKKEISIYIDGAKNKFRLIIEPSQKFSETDNVLDFLSKCDTIKNINVLEVSSHYE